MRPANRLACVAAALLLLAIAGAKASDIKDPRAGSDRAPLKVDRVAFNAQQQGQLRRRLLSTGQPAAVPQKQQTAVREMAAASNRATAIKAKPAAAAAAATEEPSQAAGAAQAAVAVPAKPSQQDASAAAAAADAPTSADAQQQEQQVMTKEAQQALLAGISKGLSAHPKKAADKVQEPAVKVEEMTLEQLLAEDAPPTTCRGAPVTNGIKWNVGCAHKPLGGSCNGIVLSGPPFCNGQGGSIATIKCMPDGEWGSVQTLC